MKLLIIGGTGFLGRHIVQAALASGHEVTLFNRGYTDPDLFLDIESLRGDRNENLSLLQGRYWDAVIDTCGRLPRQVRRLATLLADTAGHYTFISSVSVYADFSRPGIDEHYPVAQLEGASPEEFTPEAYGALKALCEQEAEAAMPGRVLNVRPGLIVGPYDTTDRFTYWPHRVAQGGDILAPGSENQPVQFIDARDLAEWLLAMVEARKTGIYNAKGPDYPLTMQRFLDECKEVSRSNVQFVWANEEFLLGHNIAPYVEMPLWVPGEMIGFARVNSDKAIAAGLSFRPLADTIRDTLAWDATRPPDTELRAGLSRAREKQLLQAWCNT